MIKHFLDSCLYYTAILPIFQYPKGDKMKKYAVTKSFTFDGRRYYVRADTEKEALKKMYKKQADLEEGRVVVSGPMTVADWTEKALATYKAIVSPSVLKDMRYRIRKHIIQPLGQMRLQDVKPIHCQEILNAQAGLSYSHIQKIEDELHFIFRTAVENGLLLKDPSVSAIPPKGKKGSRLALSSDEEEAFLAVAGSTDRFRIFELMYWCGCRPEEAIAAVGSDVLPRRGKHVLHIRGTKSEAGDRIVPIRQCFYEKISGTAADAPIAPNQAGRPHTESSYNRAVKSLRRSLNICMGAETYRNALVPPLPLRESFVPYDLRHTYCTNLARQHVDIRIAQKLMGHATLAMTADIYTHVDEELILDDVLDLLG